MKLVSLLSGGIDSPVAAYLMLKKGAELVAVHADNHDDEKSEGIAKTAQLVRRLEELSGKTIPLNILSHAHAQRAFSENCNRHFQCLFCKRMMFRMGEKIARLEGAQALLTGDSLGQVASQTLTNMGVESQAVQLPILRPLIGMDKVEIIDIAKAIGTYEISIQSAGEGCPFVPNKPSTSAQLEKVLEEESKIDVVGLVKKAVEGRKRVG